MISADPNAADDFLHECPAKCFGQTYAELLSTKGPGVIETIVLKPLKKLSKVINDIVKGTTLYQEWKDVERDFDYLIVHMKNCENKGTKEDIAM